MSRACGTCEWWKETEDRFVDGPSGVGQWMPRAWFSIETTRSRRPSNSLAFGLMKSCGPFSASTAAHCETDDGLDVVWLITLAIALISGSGPAA